MLTRDFFVLLFAVFAIKWALKECDLIKHEISWEIFYNIYFYNNLFLIIYFFKFWNLSTFELERIYCFTTEMEPATQHRFYLETALLLLRSVWQTFSRILNQTLCREILHLCKDGTEHSFNFYFFLWINDKALMKQFILLYAKISTHKICVT